ncbi:MAG: hypothetical protein QXH07_07435 [Thermoplasmata archaeon]
MRYRKRKQKSTPQQRAEWRKRNAKVYRERLLKLHGRIWYLRHKPRPYRPIMKLRKYRK